MLLAYLCGESAGESIPGILLYYKNGFLKKVGDF